MSSPFNRRGPLNLQITSQEGSRELKIPDPADLPVGLLLSPPRRHVLRVLRENVVPCCLASTNGESGMAEIQPQTQAELNDNPNGRTFRLPAEFCPQAVSKFLQNVSKAVELGPANPKRAYHFHERTQKKSHSPSRLRKKRLERAIRSGNPFKTGLWKCCARKQCFRAIGPDRCYREYKEVNSMNPVQAKRYLISLYDQKDKVFRIGGHNVCYRFLQKALGFSNDVQCSIKNTPKSAGSAIARSRPREVKRKTKRVFIATFIKQLARLFGDAMPHKEQITLPVLNRKALWMECEEAWKSSGDNHGDEVISRAYFYRIWRIFAEFVSVRKNNGFTECSRCELLRAEMAKHLRDEETLVVLIEQHAVHLRFIEEERTAYEGRQSLAEQNPARYCSIIIDGADQKNYGLPHFAKNTKSDSGHKLKVKVVGVLEHVLRGKEWLSLFTITEEYETGANHIIEVAHRTLQRKKDKLGRLPPTLFVQVDNCIRENKNRYFMAYFRSLVHLGVFKMVQISFLPIGHTHADIDQTFSSISKHLTINDAITLADLLAELEKCYGQRVTASEIGGIINYSGLCDQSRCLNDVEHFSEYRYFRLVQNACEDGNSGLHGSACDVKVKHSDTWIPFPTSRAEGFLRFFPSFAQTPAIVTKPLPNMREVTKCIDSAEERIEDDAKLEALRQLQAKVYQGREEAFHWMEGACFEMNGDYTGNTHSGDEVVQSNLTAHVEETLRPNYGYHPDDYVAVATNDDENTRFWIGRVKGVAEVDEEDRAKTITIRWYVASGKDPWVAKYSPAWKKDGGEQTVYEDTIDVASVLVRFESLTTSNKLRVRDKKAIKQTLDEN